AARQPQAGVADRPGAARADRRDAARDARRDGMSGGRDGGAGDQADRRCMSDAEVFSKRKGAKAQSKTSAVPKFEIPAPLTPLAAFVTLGGGHVWFPSQERKTASAAIARGSGRPCAAITGYEYKRDGRGRRTSR